MTKPSSPPGGDSGGPASPPDLSALARKTLDLWQDQIGRMSQDPATLDLMTRTFSMMTKGSEALHDLPKAARDLAGLWPQTAQAAPAGHSAAHTAAASAPQPGETPADEPAPAAAQPGPATGAAPAADVSGNGADLTAELLRRIAALEERVHALESRPAGGNGNPARRRQPG
ncbi:hypothetical protein [Novispirillum itersonii]|uniref:Uncharacterized protein n=1 Tax=Novispirillum itersonii TaxID=189 RepID=A0A7X0DLE7_NOVIT|nr:hypothetical protein [Novispirillum itersonii]MBB6209911.1 hypothetical protein [Novispirillum itersonii]